MLTRKQYQLLVFIDEQLRATGVPPSFDEMKDALGLASKSGIHRLITGLEERGFIRRLPHRARAIEVLRLPMNRSSSLRDAARDVCVDATPTPSFPGHVMVPYATIDALRGELAKLAEGE